LHQVTSEVVFQVPISTTPVSTSQVEKFSSSLKEFSYSHQSPALQWKDTSKLNLHTVTTETPKIDLREEWDEIDLHQKRQLHSVEEIPEFIQGRIIGFQSLTREWNIKSSGHIDRLGFQPNYIV